MVSPAAAGSAALPAAASALASLQNYLRSTGGGKQPPLASPPASRTRYQPSTLFGGGAPAPVAMTAAAPAGAPAAATAAAPATATAALPGAGPPARLGLCWYAQFCHDAGKVMDHDLMGVMAVEEGSSEPPNFTMTVDWYFRYCASAAKSPDRALLLRLIDEEGPAPSKRPRTGP